MTTLIIPLFPGLLFKYYFLMHGKQGTHSNSISNITITITIISNSISITDSLPRWLGLFYSKCMIKFSYKKLEISNFVLIWRC